MCHKHHQSIHYYTTTKLVLSVSITVFKQNEKIRAKESMKLKMFQVIPYYVLKIELYIFKFVFSHFHHSKERINVEIWGVGFLPSMLLLVCHDEDKYLKLVMHSKGRKEKEKRKLEHIYILSVVNPSND